jgi:hypothetical protein
MDVSKYVLVVFGVLAVALMLTGVSSNLGADYEEVGKGVAGISVALAFLGFGLMLLQDSGSPPGTCVVAGGGSGIIFAFIVEQLNSNGVLVDEFITGSITISDVMVMIVILWLLVGIILEVSR